MQASDRHIRSVLLALALAVATWLSPAGEAAAQGAPCVHLGQQVNCPPGISPGSTSLFFLSNGTQIQFSNGGIILSSLCCSPFTPVIVPVTPTTPTSPTTSVATGTSPALSTVLSASNIRSILGSGTLNPVASTPFLQPPTDMNSDFELRSTPLASYGERLKAVFDNVPTGVRLFVATTDPGASADSQFFVNTNRYAGTDGLRYAPGFVPVGVVVDDLTRDNLVDVIALNRGSGNVSTNLGSGAAAADIGTVNAGGFTPVSVTSDRLNDDAFMDIAVANSAGGIEVFNQSVVGTLLQPMRTVPVGASPITLSRIVDFNPDGFPDFAVATSAGGPGAGASGVAPGTTVLLNRPDAPGAFTVQPGVPLIDPLGPTGGVNHPTAVGDFNADGRLDAVRLYTATSLAADFDGSGQNDVVLIESNGGAVFVLLNVNAGATSRAAAIDLNDLFPRVNSTMISLNSAAQQSAGAFQQVSRLGLPLINEAIAPLRREIAAGCAGTGVDCTSGLRNVRFNPTDGQAPIVTFAFGPGQGGPQQWGRVIVTPDNRATAQVFLTSEDRRLRSIIVTPPLDGPPPASFRDGLRQTMLLVGNETAGTQRVARPLQQASIGDGSFRAAVEASDAGANRVGGQLPIDGRTYLPVVMKPNLPPAR
jgi:hypothetical protein